MERDTLSPTQRTLAALAAGGGVVTLEQAREALIASTGRRVSYTATEASLAALVRRGVLEETSPGVWQTIADPHAGSWPCNRCGHVNSDANVICAACHRTRLP